MKIIFFRRLCAPETAHCRRLTRDFETAVKAQIPLGSAGHDTTRQVEFGPESKGRISFVRLFCRACAF